MSDLDQTDPAPERRLRRIPFTTRDEASIRALSYWMQIAAVLSILGAVFEFISAFTPRQDFSKIIGAVLRLLIGIWIYQAGAAFHKVATTDTADQRHLMEGFSLLRRVFLLQSILVILVLSLLLVVLLVAVLFLAGSAVRTG